MVEVKIKLIGNGKMPEFKTDGAVCADCYARVDTYLTIRAGERVLVPLGFAMELPKWYEAVLRPRSGLTKKGIDNGIGTIDFDYRGECCACVINNSGKDFEVHNGDRICQIAIRKAEQVEFCAVDELSDTERGAGGFGHTGI